VQNKQYHNSLYIAIKYIFIIIELISLATINRKLDENGVSSHVMKKHLVTYSEKIVSDFIEFEQLWVN